MIAAKAALCGEKPEIKTVNKMGMGRRRWPLCRITVNSFGNWSLGNPFNPSRAAMKWTIMPTPRK